MRTIALELERGLPLPQALAALLLIADQTPERYGRPAARWLAKLISETRAVELDAVRELASVLGTHRHRQLKSGS